MKNSKLKRDVESTADEDMSISSLPDELIIRILNFLPTTKDGAILSTTSKRMRSLFRWSTKLDFDDSSIHHCLTGPRLTERFLAFKTFVDAVLEASLSPKLDRFRLRLGGDHKSMFGHGCACAKVCFPYVSPSQLNTWMCFPLTRPRGIREIDICIHVSNRTQCMLQPAFFTCETLEVLKLDVNFDLAQVCASRNFRLPNLKILHLSAAIIPEDDLISRLVSSCPSLEELYVSSELKSMSGNSVAVSSPTLRKLTLLLGDDRETTRNVVVIDTPNLQHLIYSDNLANCYSVSSMSALVQATLEVWYTPAPNAEFCFPSLMSLVKAAVNVQELTLGCLSLEVLDHDMLNDCLPVFRNLKRLVLSHNRFDYHKWRTLLLGFLNHSPSLETLNIRSGLVTCNIHESDHEIFETTQEIPLCCVSSLKRIVLGWFKGSEQEVRVLRSLLGNTFVLEELFVEHCHGVANQMLIKDMPRASPTCTVRIGALHQVDPCLPWLPFSTGNTTYNIIIH